MTLRILCDVGRYGEKASLDERSLNGEKNPRLKDLFKLNKASFVIHTLSLPFLNFFLSISKIKFKMESEG